MAKDLNDPFTSPAFEDGKCAICKTCRIYKRTGRCVYGGPFIGYGKVIYEPGTVRESTEDSAGTTS